MREEEKKKMEKQLNGVGNGGAGEKKAEDEGRIEKKADEVKKDGGNGDKKSEGVWKKVETTPLLPPEEIVMRVCMHCEGCARKVKRSLKGFEGVEYVTTDCRTDKVVVKGKVAAADPLRVVDRVAKKSGRKVELLTPIPPKPIEEEKRIEVMGKAETEEKREEPPVMCVVLKVYMHCEACSQEIKKRILRMKGVQSVDPDLKTSEVTVKGVFELPKLLVYVHQRTSKHAVVVKAELAEKKPKDEGKDAKATNAGSGQGEKTEGRNEDIGNDGANRTKEDGSPAAPGDASHLAAKFGELTKNPLFYNYTRHPVEYAYPPRSLVTTTRMPVPSCD